MIDALKPYPEYKESGVSWLGKVPTHWKVRRIKTVLRELDCRSTDGSGTLLSLTRLRGLIAHRDMTDKVHSARTLVGYKMYRPGQIVMNRMQAWSGMFGAGSTKGLVSPDYAVFEILGGLSEKLILERLKTLDLVGQFALESKGIGSGFNRLYTDRFGPIPISLPPSDEQDAIVRFLEHGNGRVERGIRAKKKLIALLHEQKQGIIYRALTRGLDPNVPLRTSGIPWVGDIPKHWKLKKLKFLVHNINDQTSARAKGDTYLALEHIQSWTGKICLPKDELIFESQVRRFMPDDILFGKLRPYLAKVTRPQFNGVCVSELLVLRTATDEISTGYFEQKLRSKQIIDLITASTFGAKMPRADWGFIGNVQIAYPNSRQEQSAIVSYIQTESKSLDFTIGRAEREIELLREYRTRLVADVVTGKLDVRAAAMKLADENLVDADTGDTGDVEPEEAAFADVEG